MQLEGTRESAYLRQVKWFKHYYYYHTPTTRKREEEGRAASLQREWKVTAGIAACAVGAMMSLPLWVIRYTEGTMEWRTEQPIS